MTNDYKRDLLDYMTGKLTPGTQTSNYFRDNEYIENNLITNLANLGITSSKVIRTLFNEYTSNFIIYDEYTKNSKTYSYIAILNQKGEILDILTTYESGTLIEKILYLDIDENGYIYGIDKPNDQPYYRIIQLNNMAVPIGNNYVCRLRSSYYINYNDFSLSASLSNYVIKKVPGEAKYFIFGKNTSQNKTELITFSNIVGIPLEWNTYLGKNISTGEINLTNYVIENSDNTPKVDIFYKLDTGGTNVEHEYFDGETLITKTTVSFPQNITYFTTENQTTIYGTSRNNNGDGTYTITIYKSISGTITKLFDFLIEGTLPDTNITFKNGILFFKTETFIGNIIRCGAYYNNNVVLSETYKLEPSKLIISLSTNLQNYFNLYKFNAICEDGIYQPSIVIYDNQYSGGSYQDYNSLIPAHSEIYSNGYIQFARDLYNKQVFENQTLAVVNVPFNYLNGMTLNPTNLLGQTMTTLVNDKKDITKNKYENVYINFLNKINVVDEDTGEIYPQTANYVNKNINIGTSANYGISKLTKVRINFSTPQVKSIKWQRYYNYYQTGFLVQIGNEVPVSIDFISEDETTTYITKKYHFHKNTEYLINEKVRIVNSLQKEELMYNNQNVLYDHNQVMVYEKE